LPAIANQRQGQQAHFGLELTFDIVHDGRALGRQFLLWVDAGPGPEVTAEAKKQNGKRRDDYRDSNTTFFHRPHSKSGS
jgi:hypothetical protein